MNELLNDLKINFFPRVKFNPAAKTKAEKEANTKLTPVSAFVTIGDSPRIRIPGIVKVAPENWIYAKPKDGGQRVRVSTAAKDYKAAVIAKKINADLDAAADKIIQVCKEHLERYGAPPTDMEAFKERIIRRIKGQPDIEVIEEKPEALKSDSLLEYIENFIIEADPKLTKPPRRTFVKKSSKHLYTKRSLTTWQSYLREIRKYCATQNHADLKFSDIDMNFYEKFENYMAGKGFSANYFGAYIKTIKKFMGEAEKEGFHDNSAYKDKSFLKTKAKADGKALTIDQLRSLAEFDFSDNLIYDNARDLFLVGCWTGLRVNDYMRLNRSHISDDGTLDIETSKQKEYVAVPILPELEKIIEKYKNTETGFPRAISDVELNEHIKDICRIVGEHSDKSFLEIQAKETKLASGASKIEKEPLYKFISTHVGRRSFCTNAIKMGMPAESIKKISGHKTDSSFEAYVKIKPRDSSKLMLRAFLAYNKEREAAV